MTPTDADAGANAAAPFGGVRLRIDPWSADYDAGAGQLEPDTAAAAVDPSVELASWSALRPAARVGSVPALLFVDGVRRIDCRFVAERDERTSPGLFGSFAVGAVHSASLAKVVTEHVHRCAATALQQALPAIAFRLGTTTIRYQPEPATDDSPDAPLRALQNAMRRSEAEVAGSIVDRGEVVFLDGPLAATMPAGPFVGYVKRLLRSYLGQPHAGLLPQLAVGERTPLFLVRGAPLDRLSWYQRIGHGRAVDNELAGVVRCECAAGLGLDTARALADLATRELVRFASDALRDPRAPQNLFPIGALETHLRHRLGDPLLLRRAIESHVAGMVPARR